MDIKTQKRTADITVEKNACSVFVFQLSNLQKYIDQKFRVERTLIRSGYIPVCLLPELF